MGRTIASLAVAGLLAAQLTTGVARASERVDGCTFGSGTLTATAVVDGPDDLGDVSLWVEGTSLRCTADAESLDVALADVDAIAVDADGYATIAPYDALGSEHPGVSLAGIDLDVAAGGLFTVEAALASTSITVTAADDSLAVNGSTGTLAAAGVYLVGGDGADVLDGSGLTSTPVIAVGGRGDDVLRGGGGDDLLVGNGTGETPCGYAGAGASDRDLLAGGPGDDEIVAGASGAATRTVADDDLDTVLPGTGSDVVTCGAALVSYADTATAVAIDAAAGNAIAGTATDMFADGTYLTWVGSSGSDAFTGTDAAESFSGGAGGDVADGGGGADQLSGGTGDDVLLGGPGNDTLAGAAGTDETRGGDGRDRCLSGEIVEACEVPVRR